VFLDDDDTVAETWANGVLEDELNDRAFDQPVVDSFVTGRVTSFTVERVEDCEEGSPE
jgi:hypothetical protein